MWVRVNDKIFDSFKLSVARTQMQRLTLVGAHIVLVCSSASNASDGWLTEATFRDTVPPSIRPLLRRSVMGKAPLIHGAGDRCRCMEGRAWPSGADYLVHDYLDYNPQAAESDLHKRQKRERRNPSLVRRVRLRDADLCRYCGRGVKWDDRRGPQGAQLDHVDPRQAGEANLVVACRNCNVKKGRRTPEEAGMQLLVSADDLRDSQVYSSSIRGAEEGESSAINCASRDGTGRDGEEIEPGFGDTASRVRSAGEGNPYLRSAINGPQPENHAGIPYFGRIVD